MNHELEQLNRSWINACRHSCATTPSRINSSAISTFKIAQRPKRQQQQLKAEATTPLLDLAADVRGWRDRTVRASVLERRTYQG